MKLSIGGFTFEFFCQNPSLGADLARRYSPFLDSSQGTPLFQIQHKSISGDAVMNFPVVREMKNNSLIYHRGQSRAVIDKKSKEVVLECPNDCLQADSLLRVLLAHFILTEKAFLIHGLGLNFGFLFFGNAGSGKSTLATLFGPKPVLNEEISLLRKTDAGWMLWGTPFYGTRKVNAQNSGAFLKKLFYLSTPFEPFRKSLQPSALSSLLSAQILQFSNDEKELRDIIPLVAEICETFPGFEFQFDKREKPEDLLKRL